MALRADAEVVERPQVDTRPMIESEPETPVIPPTEVDRYVLVLDLSKSMLAPLPDPNGAGSDRQKIEVARTAVYRILENAERSSAFFGLVTFTEVVRVAVALTEIRRENLPYIESLIGVLTPSGRSAIWDAMATGANMLRLGNQGVHGHLVLVTDGWDNASGRYEVVPEGKEPTPGRTDLVPHMLPTGSILTLRVIGIGSGDERDKGVDAPRMNELLTQLRRRAAEIGAANDFSYQEVVTGSQLFAQMVGAFLDVDYETIGRPIDQLHPEELARNAATAARALKSPTEHATVHRLSGHFSSAAGKEAVYSEAPGLEVDVISAPQGVLPSYLKERYGPLGSAIEAYVQKDYTTALERLGRSGNQLPPVTRLYWEARTHFAMGEVVDAARLLLQAWEEAEKLPPEARGRIIRRLALLQARMQDDRETETLVKFIDETDGKLERKDPELRARLQDLFTRLMELRGTYQLTRIAPQAESADAAQKHEAAVEQVFGLLQDTRLENTSQEPAVENALDFIELCLAELK
ncbi:MAG: vWA domain-containing protein [Thermoplasmata archaeon]